MQRIYLLVILFNLLVVSGFSQTKSVFIPQQFDFRWEQDQWLKEHAIEEKHYGIRQSRTTYTADTAMYNWYRSKYKRSSKNSYLGRKVFNEHLLRVGGKDFSFSIDPLMNFQGGMDFKDTSSNTLYTNTRGVQLQGNITEKVFFYGSFYENQSDFPTYVDSAIKAAKVVPGFGSPKPFGDGGYDYNMATGLIRFEPIENLGFQYGHDKLFIGEGYRSILWSDNAFNYPSLQADVALFKNKLYYQVNYAILQQTKLAPSTLDGDRIKIRKLANIHYLSYKPLPELEVGISEVVMWQRWDDSTGTLLYEPLYLNPIPFVNSLVKIDSLNKGYIGLNLSYTLNKSYVGFGQLLYSNDEISGYQIGAKAYDLLGVNGLYIHAEFNSTTIKAYGSGDLQTDFYHMGQPMAFVQGNDATEIIGTVRYTFRGLFAQTRVQQINRQGQHIQILSGEGGYLLNPRYNLNIYGGAMLRDADGQEATQWFYAGLRTSITNMYLDF